MNVISSSATLPKPAGGTSATSALPKTGGGVDGWRAGLWALGLGLAIVALGRDRRRADE